jgi:hypothetical protein
LWKNHELIAAKKQKKTTKYHKYDFRQRNFAFILDRAHTEALNKGILRCKFMHIQNEKEKHSVSFFPFLSPELKENLFIQFLCCFYVLS